MTEIELKWKKDRDNVEMEQYMNNQVKELPEDIQKMLKLQYPISPFYMRGENYSPLDLNANTRDAWIKGYKYKENGSSTNS